MKTAASPKSGLEDEPSEVLELLLLPLFFGRDPLEEEPEEEEPERDEPEEEEPEPEDEEPVPARGLSSR